MKKKIDFSLISRIVKIASLVFITLCFVCLSLPAITVVSGSVTKTYGPTYSFIFKGTIKTNNISYNAYGLSPITLIAFIILVLSALALLASFIIKDKNKNIPQWLTFASAILILIGSILLFCSHKSIASSLADTLIKGHSDAVSKTIFDNSKIEFGIWGPATFALIPSFLSLTSLLFDGTFDKVRAKIGII